MDFQWKAFSIKKVLCNRGYQYSLIFSSLTAFSIVYYQTQTKYSENVWGWFGWKCGNVARNQVKLRVVKIGFQRLVGIETRVPTSSVLVCWDSCCRDVFGRKIWKSYGEIRLIELMSETIVECFYLWFVNYCHHVLGFVFILVVCEWDKFFCLWFLYALSGLHAVYLDYLIWFRRSEDIFFLKGKCYC